MKYLAPILNNPLFKVSSLNAVSVFIKIITGVIAGKILAVFIGPSGFAIIGNLRNALATADTFSTFGIQNGVIKYVAGYENNKLRLYPLLSTVFISVFVFATVLSIAVFFLSGILNDFIFGEKFKYSWVFKVMAFTLPWHAANIIFMSVVNGLKQFKQVIIVNIAGNVSGLLISAILIWKLNLPGAFLGLIISPALLFVFSFYLINRHFQGFSFLTLKNFDVNVLRRLFSYSLMSFVTAILGQAIFISIRNQIISNAGLEEAGFWEGMNRIAFFYLMFVATLLSLYFLPKLSTAKDTAETRSVILSYYRVIVPLFIAGCCLVYLLRFFIIKVQLSEAFMPMEKLFIWQLVGDIFKVCSMILGYQFLAKKMTKAFIITEIMSFAMLYFSSAYLINLYGAEGAVMAHAATFFIYFLVLLVYFRKVFSINKPM